MASSHAICVASTVLKVILVTLILASLCTAQKCENATLSRRVRQTEYSPKYFLNSNFYSQNIVIKAISFIAWKLSFFVSYWNLCWSPHLGVGRCQHWLSCRLIGGRVGGLCAFGLGVCCTIVRPALIFATPCNSISNRHGTCYPQAECIRRGGIPEGTCQVLGVCCVFVLNACSNLGYHPTPSENCTYVQNPGYPGTFGGMATCTFNIGKRFRNVCQMRLDFIDFDIDPPVAGTCTTDMYTVTGQNTGQNVPKICGINTGQSIYVDVSAVTGPIFQTFMLTGRRRARWNIKVTQILCNDFRQLAPPGCLMYFTGTSGTVKSFNYATTTPTRRGYQVGHNYDICFRREAGFCSITYTNAAGQQFEVGIDAPGLNCPLDYLQIAGVRRCGNTFPVTTDTSGGDPFRITQVVNPLTQGYRGYCLNYMLNRCRR